MTRAVISDVIAHGEGSTVEFKRSMTKDIGRALCAFANADGGTILIGVSDAGKIVGVADHNRLKSRMQSTARSADPQIKVDIESVGRVLRAVHGYREGENSRSPRLPPRHSCDDR